MNICRFFITKPVTTIVFMMLISLFGYLNLKRLPVNEYPNIEVPTISISTTYSGAASNVIETKVTQLVENAVAGIEGLDSIQSSSKEGKSNIQLEFAVNRDVDAAANDVRDCINRLLNRLPDGADIPIVRKYDSNSMPVIMVAISNPSMTKIELSDYADRYIVDRFSVLDGVASVNLMGQYEQSMKILLNRKEMAARGVTVADIENALKTENTDYPAGRIESVYKEFPIIFNCRNTTPDDFERIIVAKDTDGTPIRISDVAHVEIASKNQRSFFKANGETTISLGISKQSTANTIAISKNARELIKTMQSKLPKGMKLEILKDESEFIQQSIAEVFETMIIAAILVFVIVFVFTGTLRAALIPAMTVPISLIGTCIVLNFLNYSINVLTLLAMVMATGIVVDDAILVLENIIRHIDEGEDPFTASINGSKQVLFAVISTTAVLLAVFLPIGMLPGKTGKLFNEFSITIAASVFLSGIVALSLTPMLCSRFLTSKKTSKFNQIVNYIMHILQTKYICILQNLLSYKKHIVVLFVIIFGVTISISYYLPGEYEPKEDRNTLTVKVDAPEGTGYYAMTDYMDTVLNKIYPLRDQGLAVNIFASVPGFKGSDGAVNSGMVMIELKKQEARSKSVFQIASDLMAKLSNIPGVKASPVFPMGIGSKGSHALQFVLGGYNYEELAKWRDIVFEKVKKYPGISDIDSDFKETTPKIIVTADKDRAGDIGISSQNIGSTLEVMLGSKNITVFSDRGREYDVTLQSDKESRDNLDDISNIYVKSERSSELVPLDNLVTISEIGEAGKLGRHNRSRAITLSGNVGNGYTISEAMKFLEKIVQEYLPSHAQIHYRGQLKDYKESEGGILYVFFLVVLVAYLVLAAQFESFISPIVVMMTVPLGVFGAVLILWILGYTMNVYTQIGIIMLIGLSAKHGILIVEFANQLREKGLSLEKAVLEASKLRIRPIIMTGISTVMGAIPLLLATGAGSVGRCNLGVVEVFGGISGILLTLIIIPIGYILFNASSLFIFAKKSK